MNAPAPLYQAKFRKDPCTAEQSGDDHAADNDRIGDAHADDGGKKTHVPTRFSQKPTDSRIFLPP